MIGAGIVSVLVSWRPIDYLQVFIVFSTSGAAATFLFPALMACYWRRATTTGVVAAMVSGALTVLTLYLIGIFGVFDVPGQIYIGAVTTFRPYYLFGLEPLLWGLLVSTISGIVVSLLTKPLDEEIVSRMFDAEEPSGNS